MELIFKKISSYNLFNYLFTGFVFVFMCKFFLNRTFYIESDSRLIELGNLFWVYFVGLTVSRFGSIVVEPCFRRCVGFAPYDEFIEAEKKDGKLSALSEQNNVYRTVVGVLLLFAGYYLIVEYSPPECSGFISGALVLSLLVLYAFSYVKQINFIKKRVAQNLKKQNSGSETETPHK